MVPKIRKTERAEAQFDIDPCQYRKNGVISVCLQAYGNENRWETQAYDATSCSSRMKTSRELDRDEVTYSTKCILKRPAHTSKHITKQKVQRQNLAKQRQKFSARWFISTRFEQFFVIKTAFLSLVKPQTVEFEVNFMAVETFAFILGVDSGFVNNTPFHFGNNL